MELQAQLTALEEEVGMLKGEIKAILQEVRVAILARQNPFLSDDLDRPAPVVPSPSPIDAAQLPAAAPAIASVTNLAQNLEPAPAPRAFQIAASEPSEPEDAASPRMSSKRPVDLAALMVWVQESAETFSHTEFVMLVTMASYAEFFDAGLKQALLDMSEQVVREHSEKASMADFSLALKQLEAIRATTGRRRQAA